MFESPIYFAYDFYKGSQTFAQMKLARTSLKHQYEHD